MKLWIARGVGKNGRLTLHCERPTYTAGKGWDKYKLHKGHKADLKRMAREIMKIVKGN